MYFSSIRRALAAGAALVATALFIPAHAAGIQATGLQILDPGGACDSWTWGGTVQAPTLTCNAAAPPAPGVPVCSITANGSNPLTIASTTQVALHVVCSNTDAATTYAWTGTGVQSPTQGFSPQDQSVSVGATTTFSVVATNATGPSVAKSVTVTLSAGGGGGGGGGAISCTGYTRTIVVPFTYDTTLGQVVKTTDGMSTTDIVVATFTPTTNGGGGSIIITDNASGSTGFIGALSDTPCNFDPTVGQTIRKGGQLSATFGFTSTYRLTPGKPYYLNITGDSPLSIKLTAK